MHDHVSVGTAIRFTLRGSRWIPGRAGQAVDSISQDSIVDAIVFASEHANGVDPSVFVESLFSRAALLFGMLNCATWPFGWTFGIGGRRHSMIGPRLLAPESGASVR